MLPKFLLLAKHIENKTTLWRVQPSIKALFKNVKISNLLTNKPIPNHTLLGGGNDAHSAFVPWKENLPSPPCAACPWGFSVEANSR